MPDLSLKSIDSKLILIFSGLLIASLCAGLLLNQPLYFAIAPATLFGYWVLADLKQLVFLIYFTLPICVHMEFGGSALEMPTEPLMLIGTLSFVLYYLLHPESLKKGFVSHVFILMLLLHVVWISISVMHSVDQLVSVKYLIAKLWYIVVFVFFTAAFIKTREDMKKMFWSIFYPLLVVTINNGISSQPHRLRLFKDQSFPCSLLSQSCGLCRNACCLLSPGMVCGFMVQDVHMATYSFNDRQSCFCICHLYLIHKSSYRIHLTDDSCLLHHQIQPGETNDHPGRIIPGLFGNVSGR